MSNDNVIDYDSILAVTCRMVNSGEIKSFPVESNFAQLTINEPYEILSWGAEADKNLIFNFGLSPVKFPDKFYERSTMSNFLQGKDLTNTDLSNLDLSDTLNNSSLFRGSSLPPSIADVTVGKKTNFVSMFQEASGDLDLSKWDTSEVTDLYSMFNGFKGTLKGLEKWDISKVVIFQEMFKDCPNVNIDLSSWDVSRYKGKPYKFDENTPNWTLPKPNWIIPEVPNPGKGYIHCRTKDSVDEYVKIKEGMSFDKYNEIVSWGESDVMIDRPFMRMSSTPIEKFPNDAPKWTTSLSHIFSWNNYVEHKEIEGWDVSHITDFSSAFENSVIDADLSKWDVHNGLNFSSMFALSNIHGSISGWDIRNATNLSGMFKSSYSFNEDLSSWNVEKFPEEPNEFSASAIMWSKPKPIWGTRGKWENLEPEVPEVDPPIDPEEPLRVGMIRCLDKDGKIVDVTITKGVVIIPDGVRVVLDWGYITSDYMESLDKE